MRGANHSHGRLHTKLGFERVNVMKVLGRPTYMQSEAIVHTRRAPHGATMLVHIPPKQEQDTIGVLDDVRTPKPAILTSDAMSLTAVRALDLEYAAVNTS